MTKLERMEYFVRFVEEKEHAQSDLDRGWSMMATGEKEYLKNLAPDGDIRINPITGEYCIACPGLCGYGPYDSIEDARDAAERLLGSMGTEPWLDPDGYFAIYSGSYEGDDGMGFDCFDPMEIIEIKKI